MSEYNVIVEKEGIKELLIQDEGLKTLVEISILGIMYYVLCIISTIDRSN